MKRSFRELYIWNASVDLATEITSIAETFIALKRYALADQMQRAAFSVPSNIAEGQGRLTTREWRHFLGYARGSLYELETHLEIAGRRSYITTAQSNELRTMTAKIGCGLTRLIRHLEKVE